MRVLIVGDIHVKTNNLDQIDKLQQTILEKVNELTPDFVVFLGDVLDYHEKIITPCLNKACDLIKSVSSLCKLYVLVGNHDYISNTQFLSENHWMNALKQWNNVVIVDKVIVHEQYTFCPYVYPGRLVEALETNSDYLDSKVLFCHQEFRGCDMGVVVSESGDEYNTLGNFKYIISGHIHDSQWLSNKVFYVGAPLQHAFSESDKRLLCLLDNYELSEVPIHVHEKLTLTVTIDDCTNLDIANSETVSWKVVINCTPSESKSFRKTLKYKQLSKSVKIVFNCSTKISEKFDQSMQQLDFLSVCKEKISKSKNSEVLNGILEESIKNLCDNINTYG